MQGIVLVLCAQILLVQDITAQCIGAIDSCGYEVSWATTPFTSGAPYTVTTIGEWAYTPASTLAASNGPGVIISSASPLTPAGVSVISENVYEGGLAVAGSVPYIGTVALEGALPTAGVGAIVYSCGNCAVGITAEDLGAIGFNDIAGFGYGAGTAYGSGIGYGPSGYTIMY